MGKHHQHPHHNYIILKDDGAQHHRISVVPESYIMYSGMLMVFFYVMFFISFPATLASWSLQKKLLPGSKLMALISGVMSIVLYLVHNYLIREQ